MPTARGGLRPLRLEVLGRHDDGDRARRCRRPAARRRCAGQTPSCLGAGRGDREEVAWFSTIPHQCPTLPAPQSLGVGRCISPHPKLPSLIRTWRPPSQRSYGRASLPDDVSAGRRFRLSHSPFSAGNSPMSPGAFFFFCTHARAHRPGLAGALPGPSPALCLSGGSGGATRRPR